MAEPRDQRRLTVIQASDIVGYSCLMEADEAGPLCHIASLIASLHAAAAIPNLLDHSSTIDRPASIAVSSTAALRARSLFTACQAATSPRMFCEMA